VSRSARRSPLLIVAALVVIASAPVTAMAGAPPSAAFPCDGTWHTQAVPREYQQEHFNGIDADSASDAWAVGFYGPGTLQPLLAHFDGTSWTLVPGPKVSDASTYAVAAISPDDAWAAGRIYRGSSNVPLVLHWDGSTWSRVKVPDRGRKNYGTELRAIAAVSPDDIWVGGDHGAPGYRDRTLFEHYDGTSWSVVPSPNVPGSDTDLIRSMSAVSSDDVWAVGLSNTFSTVNRTLALHWNGTKWKIVPTPNGHEGTNNELDSISADASDDAWAVGVDLGANPAALLEHWDGTSWSIVPGPDPGTDPGTTAVAAISPDLAWAVGGQGGGHYGPHQTLAERWDGSAWTVVASESPGDLSDVAFAVTTVSPHIAWMAGSYMNQNENGEFPLIEEFCS
jgi:hypothetical protein